MAARSLQGFSRSLRRAQRSIPLLSDPSRVHDFAWQLSGSPSYSSERFSGYGGADKNTPTSRVSRLFTVQGSIAVPQVGCGSLSGSRGGWSPATISGQVGSYSSLAMEIRDEDVVRGQAADIGYAVLGKFSAEVPTIIPQSAFAVIQVGSHQFKVSPGDMIYTEKLKYADINDKLLLNKVLLMGSLEKTIIGRPIVPEAGVLAVVEEIALDEKVLVFKKKRRKNYRRNNGHRQELTRLRILHIEGIKGPT